VILTDGAANVYDLSIFILKIIGLEGFIHQFMRLD